MKVYVKMVGLTTPNHFVVLEMENGDKFIWTDKDRLDPTMTNKWFKSATEAKVKAKELAKRNGWEFEG